MEQDKGHNDDIVQRQNEQVKALVLSSVKRIVTNLFKSQLESTVELNQQYLAKLIKNQNKISKEVYSDLSWWDIGMMGQLRKKTLDRGNDSLREIEDIFNKINITLK